MIPSFKIKNKDLRCIAVQKPWIHFQVQRREWTGGGRRKIEKKVEKGGKEKKSYKEGRRVFVHNNTESFGEIGMIIIKYKDQYL